MSSFGSVLIIDDNPDALSLLGDLLTAVGAKQVSRVSSAEDALVLLEQESFSIILSDYKLEGMDGVEFLERLRSSGNETPVLMISGAPEKRQVIQATRHTRVDFFPKPFNIAELTGAMERLLAA